MSNKSRFSSLASSTSELKSKPTEMEKKIITKMLDNNDLTCSICFDVFEKPSELNCSHVFCFKCVKNWMRNNRSCPICRRTILDSPVVCTMLEKLILEMKSASVPVENRRYTINAVYITQASTSVSRSAVRKDYNYERPPWR
ncbi:E3 ubiquitin-protein ligase rnf8-B-like isoform X1 [Rhopalosiphum padi]|uniref:E3 ubiquitin-protein ligase rnf8-B-like isoform X1 n=2 Tax=Rhopalosiphum padi TaxID=40932 RepID=UPI00298E0039|nr:E3 ubiquitin-protein ligase rnf8-B-like isoform X1 [Rhopalosiphum padi]